MPADVALTPIDYMVAILILLIPVAIGLYYAVKDAHKSSRDEYLLEGRQMPVVPVMLSLFITFQIPIRSCTYGQHYSGYDDNHLLHGYCFTFSSFGSGGTLYTSIGGYKSVVWTDVFQTVVIALGTAIIIIKACMETGGVREVWRLAQEGGRLNFNRFTPDLTVRNSIWGVTIAHCFIWLVNGFSQSTLQRISSMKTLQDAKVAYLILTVFFIVYGAVFCFLGFIIFAYFSIKQCDPLKANFISNRN
ncbi:sodium-coupled monocarboxylate transporter 1 [Elysia marginata]|uniref:Sodium-coupled monocarboxylate transporter 1 n=1 Tax=Elysia marginata TaxID=1093978 RepID=A0AAV4FJR7_9GAST|nr:sodium-coupled monocarboxylate transporter 1 [Elysia marginata]